MCDYCVYNINGTCTATWSWRKIDTEDGSCTLFKDRGDDDAAE